MTLKIECNSCEKILTEPGALLFSPPDKSGKCLKIHICAHCWQNHWLKASLNEN